MTAVQTVTTDLRAEAAAEVRRLTAARALAGDADDDTVLVQLESDGPWMTSARRRGTLRRRALFVWRAAYEDASGGLVESCLVPVAIELSTPPERSRRRAWAAALVRGADAEMRAQIDAACLSWREGVSRTARAFVEMRLARERAIAAHTMAAADHPFQPGLFDRRAERNRRVHAAATAEAGRAAADRLAAIEHRAPAAPGVLRLLLVLLP